MSRKRKSKHRQHQKPLSPKKIDEILRKEKEKMLEGTYRNSNNLFPNYSNYRPVDSANCPVQNETEVSSLLPICPGAIVFLSSNYTTGALQYLEKRPLLVLAVQSDLRMNGVTCCSIGHRNNPGIMIHLRIDDNHCIGGIDTSVIYPWALHSLDISKISTVGGYLRPDIFEAVKRATAYHLGLSNEVPPYMRDLQYDVEYFTGRDFDGYNRYRAVNEDTTVEEEHQPPQVIVLNPDTNTNVEPPKENSVPFVQAPPEEKRDTPTPVEEGMRMHIKDIVSSLGEQDIIDLLSRRIKISELAERYKISESHAYKVRSRVEEIYVSYNFMKRIRGRIQGNAKNLKFLSDIEKVVFAVHGSPERLEMKDTDFEKAKSEYLIEFNIDLSNGVKFPKSFMMKSGTAIDMKIDVDISDAKL